MLAEADVHRVARAAVEETLTALGLDTSDPEAVIEAQHDFAYLRRARRGQEDLRRWTKRTGIGVIVTAFLWGIWHAFETWLKRGG